MLNLLAQSSLLDFLVKKPSTIALIPNASDQVYPNTSSTSVFSYIIPFGQKQDCNIYGPICQTGTITVGVNLTTATTTTVLPCSSYLRAQKAYLEYENYPGVPADDYLWENHKWYLDYPILVNWDISFGQSPECRSYAEARAQGKYTFSGCGSSNTVVQASEVLPSQIPPGLVRYWDPGSTAGTCCGDCSLDVQEVRLYYFLDKMTIDCQQNQTSNFTSTLPARNLRKSGHSLVVDGSTAVISGHTL